MPFEWVPDPSLVPAGGCLVNLRQFDSTPCCASPNLYPATRHNIGSSRRDGPEVIGRIDQAEPYRISGWAFYSHQPAKRVVIELLLNGTSIATVCCNEYRKDLKEAGIGDGQHAFAWVPDPSLLQPGSYTVEARDTGSGQNIWRRRLCSIARRC